VKWKTTLLSAFQIARPVNVLIGMLSIFIAAVISGTIQPYFKVLLAVLSGGIITAAANTVNDYYDLEIDKINKPNRPLPAGKLSRKAAFWLWLCEFITGIVLSGFINTLAFFIATVFSVILFFYSFILKRLPLWGNFAVSLSSAMAFVYGGVAVNRVRQTLIPAGFAFFYHFGREIIKDMQDLEGDAHGNAKTFPLLFGKKAAIRLVTLIFILLILLTILPYVIHWYGGYYFLVIVIGVYPVLIYALISIRLDQGGRNLGLVSNVLKADMLIGLLAIYLG